MAISDFIRLRKLGGIQGSDRPFKKGLLNQERGEAHEKGRIDDTTSEKKTSLITDYRKKDRTFAKNTSKYTKTKTSIYTWLKTSVYTKIIRNLNKNGYGNNGGENGGFTGGIKKVTGEKPPCRPARNGRDREDAYHSLTIEGYRVSPELIEKVRAGSWKPEEEDKEHKNALVARGYYQAFRAVRAVLGHFLFVFIHPYMDGNGRMGRFINLDYPLQICIIL